MYVCVCKIEDQEMQIKTSLSFYLIPVVMAIGNSKTREVGMRTQHRLVRLQMSLATVEICLGVSHNAVLLKNFQVDPPVISYLNIKYIPTPSP